MQELIYSLSCILEHMNLMRNWVDIEVEKVSVCVICEIARFIQSAVCYF